MLTLQLETFDQLRDSGFEELLAQNFEEVEPKGYQDVSPMDVNWTAYYGLERAGTLKCFTLRQGSKLVGYNLFFVQPPLHSRSVVWAVNDLVYLLPELRGRGLPLIRDVEHMLRDMGVKVVMYASKPDLSLKRGRDSVGQLFAALGYEVFDHTWTKVL